MTNAHRLLLSGTAAGSARRSAPDLAQHTRVYDDYLRAVSAADLRYRALGIIGPRGAVDKITRKLRLLP